MSTARVLFIICPLLSFLQPAYAQFARGWEEINPPPNIFNDAIYTLTTDKNGKIYAAGKFKNLYFENVVASWNGTRWVEVGSGTGSLKANNVILSLATDSNGNLYAAGSFTDGMGRCLVKKWDGSAWSEVGGPANGLKATGVIYSVITDDAGNLYAAGANDDISGKKYVAKWNGTTWSALGATTLAANGFIYSLTADHSGNVYAAGRFTNAAGKYYVAKWNGTAWTETGAPAPLNANDYIVSIATDNNGNVYAGGAFKNGNDEYYVSKWNGTTWAEVGSLKANGVINAIRVNSSGTIYAGGYGTNGNGGTVLVSYNGNTWTELFNVYNPSSNPIRAIAIDPSGNVYAAGNFKNNGGHFFVAKWNGIAMTEQGRSGDNLEPYNRITSIAADTLGNIYVLADTREVAINEPSKWDGYGWKVMQGTNPSTPRGAESIVTDLAGNVYAAGRNKNADGKYYVARWDGTNWTELKGTSPDKDLQATDYIRGLMTDKAGNVYASGTFIDSNSYFASMAIWNGSNWKKLQGSGMYMFSIDDNGAVYAYQGDGVNTIWKFQNDTWVEVTSLDSVIGYAGRVNSIKGDSQGNIYTGGTFFDASFKKYLAKWNGTSWSAVGDLKDLYSINSIVLDSMDNVYAACTFDNQYSRVMKWDGTSWTEVGERINVPYQFDINILSIDHFSNLYATGSFINDANSIYVARYGNTFSHLPQPLLAGLLAEYCSESGIHKIKLMNLPRSSYATTDVKVDGTGIPIGADSSFAINPAVLSAGVHHITVTYENSHDRTLFESDLTVTPAATPEVNLTASATNVTDLTPILVTAISASGGGNFPKFTFAKARDFNAASVLQPESTNRFLTIDPNTLSIGLNRIYVRMITSALCYTVNNNMDSIDITRSFVTAITDIDNPNQLIQVYPTTFDQNLVIKGLNPGKSYIVTLTNSVGQKVFIQNARNIQEVKVTPNISRGNYWLTIYDNSKHRSLGSILLIKN